MKNKVLIVFAIMFFGQTFFSCIPCDCDPFKTFETNYIDVTVTPYNTSGFNSEVVSDKVNKDTFGLGISVIFELNKISDNFNILSDLGFAKAMACSCVEDEYLYLDPIENMTISVVDTATNEIINVANSFKIHSGYGELISLTEFFNKRENWQDGFLLELVEYDLIPTSSIFVVDVMLVSGKILSKKTEIINFND